MWLSCFSHLYFRICLHSSLWLSFPLSTLTQEVQHHGSLLPFHALCCVTTEVTSAQGFTLREQQLAPSSSILNLLVGFVSHQKRFLPFVSVTYPATPQDLGQAWLLWKCLLKESSAFLWGIELISLLPFFSSCSQRQSMDTILCCRHLCHSSLLAMAGFKTLPCLGSTIVFHNWCPCSRLCFSPHLFLEDHDLRWMNECHTALCLRRKPWKESWKP